MAVVNTVVIVAPFAILLVVIVVVAKACVARFVLGIVVAVGEGVRLEFGLVGVIGIRRKGVPYLAGFACTIAALGTQPLPHNP